MAIASHVDRPSFSIISQLGFIPEGLPLDALELSPGWDPEDDSEGRMEELQRYGLPLVRSSDAHFPGDIGKCYTVFLMEEASLTEVRKALFGEDGRRVLCS